MVRKKDSKRALSGFRVGVDIGGTFTDIVFMNREGVVLTKKVSSTPDNYGMAIINGIKMVFEEYGLTGSDVDEVVHGCTVATNAILEHTGAKTGLITTEGFRDVLEIRRFRMPELYNIYWNKPLPLSPRELRQEVRERIDPKGKVILPLDPNEVQRVIDLLVKKGIESLAVCLLHSYVNPIHEQEIKRIVKRDYPNLLITLSSELMPVIKEYERTSETVVNAYVRPAVTKYMQLLSKTMKDLGIRAPLLVMQSSGGMMSVEASMGKPIYIIECGPAAGVVASGYVARKMGLTNVLTLDMGGTTAKASIIEDGQISRAPEYEVGAGISVASRLCKGGGYVIRVPSIDIAEIGAGGGSILWIDSGGGLHSGPKSAGSKPGPVCYDTGGTSPTTTDANVVLGYLNPSSLAGGSVPLNFNKARQAVDGQVAKPLKMGIEEAAYGSYRVANSNMIRAIQAVSTERGRDPREFVLFAYGGAGPIHAAALAQELEIKRVIIPPSPGLFSAFGLLFAEIEHHLCESFFFRLEQAIVDQANQAWRTMEKKALAEIEAGGYGKVDVEVLRFMDARYVGQSSELTLPIPWKPFKKEHLLKVAKRFHAEHMKSYAHQRPDEAIDVVNLRLMARVPGREDLLNEIVRQKEGKNKRSIRDGSGHRKAYFGKRHGWLDTPVLKLNQLSEKPLRGPVIIELYDSTCVVPPRCSVSLDRFGSMVIDIQG